MDKPEISGRKNEFFPRLNHCAASGFGREYRPDAPPKYECIRLNLSDISTLLVCQQSFFISSKAVACPGGGGPWTQGMTVPRTQNFKEIDGNN